MNEALASLATVVKKKQLALNCDYKWRVVLCGEEGEGKNELQRTLLGNEDNKAMRIELGSENALVYVDLLELQPGTTTDMIQTTGARRSFKGADCVVIVTTPDTDNLATKMWQAKAQREAGINVPVMIAVNDHTGILQEGYNPSNKVFVLNAVTGEGVDALVQQITRVLQDRDDQPPSHTICTFWGFWLLLVSLIALYFMWKHAVY